MSQQKHNKNEKTADWRLFTRMVAIVIAVGMCLMPTAAMASSKAQRAKARALIVAGCKERKEAIDLSKTKITRKEMQEIYLDVKYTHGEFWYLTNDFYFCSDDNKADTIWPCYVYKSEKQYRSMKRRYDKEMKKAVKYVKKYKGSKMRALAAHDWLARHCSYDNAQRDSSCTTYSAMVKGRAVCEGYTKAYQAILQKCGVSCKATYSEDHEWNLVKVGSSWYHVDVTNDDTQHNYRHFLKSTKRLRRLYSDYFPNSGGAKCGNTKYDGKANWKLK